MDHEFTAVIIGVIFGTVGRIYMLRIDFRQYPSYPHGYLTHLSLGFIAAALGAVALPALAGKDYVAVTFLALAAQQFREIRNMERETLSKLEKNELVPRGQDYIEGIAKVFETRNYLVMAAALITSGITFLYNWPQGFVAGVLSLIALKYLMRGSSIAEICDVVPVKIRFEGAMLVLENIIVMNVGLPEAREKLSKEALCVKLKPKDDNARGTINDIGQRQAILHTASSLLGTKLEDGEPEWTPLARKDINTGELYIYLLPNEPDIKLLIEAVKTTPVLESAQRNILSTKIGRQAAD
ncbi:MAG: YIEGIA family protein [Clostridia bacterium]|nr:YIEGIA family protein [Clostridia bacterium]